MDSVYEKYQIIFVHCMKHVHSNPFFILIKIVDRGGDGVGGAKLRSCFDHRRRNDRMWREKKGVISDSLV